jgi:hypothetical protein
VKSTQCGGWRTKDAELEGELSRLRIEEFVVAMRASALVSLPRRLLLPLPLTVQVSSRAGGPYRL